MVQFLIGADGVVRIRDLLLNEKTTTPSAPLRWLRDFFFGRGHPFQGGECPRFQFIHTLIDALLICNTLCTGGQWCRRGCLPRGRSSAKTGENALEQRQHGSRLFCPDDNIPERLKLLPAGGIRCVAKLINRTVMNSSSPEDRSPTVEVAVS